VLQCVVLQRVAACCSVLHTSAEMAASAPLRPPRLLERMVVAMFNRQPVTGCRSCIECSILICFFPQKSHIISGSCVERDLQLEASYAISLPCTQFPIHTCQMVLCTRDDNFLFQVHDYRLYMSEYIYVCIYTYVYTYIYLCVYIYIYVHVYIFVGNCISAGSEPARANSGVPLKGRGSKPGQVRL